MKKKIIICVSLLLLVGCHSKSTEDNVNETVMEYCDDLEYNIEEITLKKNIENIGYYSVIKVNDNNTEKFISAYQNVGSNLSKDGFITVELLFFDAKEKVIENLGKDYGRDKNYYFGIVMGEYHTVSYDGKKISIQNKKSKLNNQTVYITTWVLELSSEEEFIKEKMLYQ